MTVMVKKKSSLYKGQFWCLQIDQKTNEILTKMNSLYQIHSKKMLHSTKVIILVEKNEKRWPG